MPSHRSITVTADDAVSMVPRHSGTRDTGRPTAYPKEPVVDDHTEWFVTGRAAARPLHTCAKRKRDWVELPERMPGVVLTLASW